MSFKNFIRKVHHSQLFLPINFIGEKTWNTAYSFRNHNAKLLARFRPWILQTRPCDKTLKETFYWQNN